MASGLEYHIWNSTDSSRHSSDNSFSDDGGGDVIVTQHDNENNGGVVIVPHGAVTLSKDEMNAKKEEFEYECTQLREELDSILDAEHGKLNKDTSRLRRWLLVEKIQSNLFDPTTFHEKMLRLKNLIKKRVNFRLMPSSQRILELLCSCIVLGKELANAGYNENIKNEKK